MLWCNCTRDGDFVTRVCYMIRRLEEQTNVVGHDAVVSVWNRPGNESSQRVKGREGKRKEEGQQIEQIQPRSKLV